MMVLEHCSIVVQESRVGSRHDVEIVGGASVLEVVHHRRYQRREDLQVR